MIVIGLIAVACVAGIGLLGKLADKLWDLHTGSRNLRISGSEYAGAMAVVTIVVLPLVMWIGSALSVNDQLTDQQFLNGVEVSALTSPTRCAAGTSGSATSGESNCALAYDTGQTYSYTYTTTTSVCTEDDGDEDCTNVPVVHVATADIWAPYATYEYHYSVTDSLGDTYNYPGVYLAAHPVPYYRGHAIPSSVPRGAPKDWLAAKAAIAAGNPRPVTKMASYENPILATDDQNYIQYSDNVQQYLREHILPMPTANILTNPIYGTSRGLADKVSFVGIKLPDEAAWEAADMQFNGGFGMKLQGDLHVVIIRSSLVDDPTQYLNALKAYWQSTQYFGHRPIAKNAVIVVIGTTNGKTVDWAQATTGMPYGNNVMLQAIQNDLPGTALTPAAVFGDPHTVVTPPAKAGAKDAVTVTLSSPPGILSEVVFKEFPFQRACMITCPSGQVGYADLIAQIHPSAMADFWMILIIMGVSLPFWWYVAVSDRFDVGRHARRMYSSVSSNLGWRN